MSNFNQLELEAINNQSFFHTKKNVTEKLYQEFGEIIEMIKQNPNHLAFEYPAGTDTTIGRIAKGENYLGLPYVIADFPRYFTKAGIFTYRIWFWWGNYYVLIWHISGEYLKQYQNYLLNRFDLFQENDCFLSISDDQWQHHIKKSSYLSVNRVTFSEFERYINRSDYFKIVQKISFDEMKSLPIRAIHFFELMIKNV